MALIIPNASEEAILQSYFDVVDFAGGGHDFRLFTNDVTSGLSQTQIEALDDTDFTEASFTGYAEVNKTGSWTITQGDPCSATNTAATFTCSSTGASQTNYGYFVTQGTSGDLAWFEYFPGPIVITNNGDSITLVPTLTLDDDQEATVTARGIIERQTLTSTGTSFTTDTVSDFAIANVEVDGTRLYKVCLASDAFLSANGRWLVVFRVDSTQTIRLADVQATSGAQNFFIGCEGLWEPATGTYDLDIYLDEGSGSANFQLQASASAPRSFWIEDIGPR